MKLRCILSQNTAHSSHMAVQSTLGARLDKSIPSQMSELKGSEAVICIPAIFSSVDWANVVCVRSG